MHYLTQYKGALEAYQSAAHRLSLIGKDQPHTTARAKGYLASVEIKTMVHFQPSDGATNYHGDVAFDKALTEVVRANFAALSKQALDILEGRIAGAKSAAMEEYKHLFGETLP